MKKTEILSNIERLERTRDFHNHAQPPNTIIKKVTPNYDYLRKGFFKQLGSRFAIPIFSLAGLACSNYFQMKIIGKENLKEIKNQGAIVTTNHINDFDCALIKHAVKHRRIFYTVGEFNNYHGFFGSLLRAAGTLPLSDSPQCMKNLTNAIGQILQDKNIIVFYPEGALWWCYEKPRPLVSGAYHYAVKNNVPILPIFFTFINKRKRKNGIYTKKFVLHIGKPIYPDPKLNQKENIKNMMDKNFEFNKTTYETFYNRKLEYLPPLD